MIKRDEGRKKGGMTVGEEERDWRRNGKGK